eukprot:jgi/Chlat1/6824/Chrsp51S06514
MGKESVSKEQNERHRRILERLMRLEANRQCADCLSRGPRWASVNLGVFVCIQCSGIHRSLGVHVSQVRSATLDTWLPEQVAFIAGMGNARANEYWEAHLPPNFKRPQESDRHALEQFIRAKYDRRDFAPRGQAPPEPLPPTDPEIAAAVPAWAARAAQAAATNQAQAQASAQVQAQAQTTAAPKPQAQTSSPAFTPTVGAPPPPAGSISAKVAEATARHKSHLSQQHGASPASPTAAPVAAAPQPAAAAQHDLMDLLSLSDALPTAPAPAAPAADSHAPADEADWDDFQSSRAVLAHAAAPPPAAAGSNHAGEDLFAAVSVHTPTANGTAASVKPAEKSKDSILDLFNQPSRPLPFGGAPPPQAYPHNMPMPQGMPYGMPPAAGAPQWAGQQQAAAHPFGHAPQQQPWAGGAPAYGQHGGAPGHFATANGMHAGFMGPTGASHNANAAAVHPMPHMTSGAAMLPGNMTAPLTRNSSSPLNMGVVTKTAGADRSLFQDLGKF